MFALTGWSCGRPGTGRVAIGCQRITAPPCGDGNECGTIDATALFRDAGKGARPKRATARALNRDGEIHRMLPKAGCDVRVRRPHDLRRR